MSSPTQAPPPPSDPTYARTWAPIPAAAVVALPPMLLLPNPFRERLLTFLLPYFRVVTKEFEVARDTVLDTLASYGAHSRPELINAARIFAFSFSALDMLAEVKSVEMSLSMKLRYRSCANGINRSCQQDEQRLAKRLACDQPGPVKSAAKSAAKPPAGPTDDTPQAEFEAAIQQAEAEIATYRNRLSGARPATSPQPLSAAHHERNQRRGAGIMMNVLADRGMPVQSKPPI
jgi:hypothetical protein